LRFFIPAIGTSADAILRSSMIPLGRDRLPPIYQQEAIHWLARFKNTELLQQMLSHFHFSESEISSYRIRWAAWLKPKKVLSIQRSGDA
jgi:hypothetical protein